MRIVPALLLGLACTAAVPAQEKDEALLGKRYGVPLRLRTYPQKTPQEALQSVIKAFEMVELSYLLAHLADPRYVDQRVREQKLLVPKGAPEEARDIVAFERVVREVSEHLRADPALVRELQQLGREGEWEAGDDKAAARLKGGTRRAFFRKIKDRWFLENRQQ
jgi:hypothetical protein